MKLKKDYHYRLHDANNVTLGYFETEGLAHQYLKKEWTTEKPYSVGRLYPTDMFIKKVKSI